MHSKNFFKYKKYYDTGVWDVNRLWNVVDKPTVGITRAEYNEITGFVFPAKE